MGFRACLCCWTGNLDLGLVFGEDECGLGL